MSDRTRIHAFAAATGVAAALLAVPGSAGAQGALTRVSADPFTNPTSQHATEVEPDTFANGSTVVAAFQVGRFFSGGASDIGFARSGDGGSHWDAPGFLPGMTTSAGAESPFERVSDASVAYDAAHATWLISSIPLLPDTSVPTVLVNRSTDDGRTWSTPVQIPPPASHSVDLDKNWTVCDNGASSPFRGHCYTELDNFGEGDRELMSTSTDGGRSWSVPIETAGHDKGLGGQPVVQPDGTVIVPFESLDGKIAAFASTDGGASWTRAVKVDGVRFHPVDGNLRTSPLPSAEIGADGTVYVAWQDCRFRSRCASNDIVFSRSADGSAWSAPARIPIDDVASGADHFIPGLAVDSATAGAATHLALTYYFYPQAACGAGCRLEVGYVSSPDGGAHWSAPTVLAGPMALTDIAQTSQGPMVGDYISTSFSAGRAVTVFPIGRTRPTATSYDEATYAPAAPLAVAAPADATRAASSTGAAPVSGIGTGETHHALRDD
ncbi:sialidase family protein [Candidatus Solirubrobacter pratensis]|uniref:sialidase family protein n=1 Tax=Candidatus Solirubrobacter pratensis TaxID=1298857 RepID=UPI00041AF7F7|nr:sialidase family protein [Candidatus Solirubrobacter pratensis]